jgi:lipoprotein-releasing system ATP-binding protein
VGPSGVGKSTLLNILGLLDEPTSGTVTYAGKETRFHGRNLVTLSGAAQGWIRNHAFGFVFQLYHLLPDLNVLENVALPLLMRTGPSAWFRSARAIKQKARDLLEEVGIDARALARPRQLSGGEKQRAAIARALIAQPEIVFCDEPTGNLDTATSARILALLWRVNKEHNTTLVIVTHDRDLAQRADRKLYMVDGKFVKEERRAGAEK